MIFCHTLQRLPRASEGRCKIPEPDITWKVYLRFPCVNLLGDWEPLQKREGKTVVVIGDGGDQENMSYSRIS